MSKFRGAIGYAVNKQTAPGVWSDEITEHKYTGELGRNSVQFQASGQVNDNIVISNEISIFGDPYAYQNFHAIRYVEFMGTKWKVTGVEVNYPRLILTVGGVYNA